VLGTGAVLYILEMDSWLERGRPALFKALAEVCDSIDSELADG
jgi:hypothetical protein